MKYLSAMLVVQDMEASKRFYTELFGMSVLMDLGVNVTFDCGLALQTEQSWLQFLGSSEPIS